MRKTILILFFLSFHPFGFSQTVLSIDSLQHELQLAKSDSNRIEILKGITNYFHEFHYDSSLYYANEIISLAEKNKDTENVIEGLILIANTSRIYGNASNGLDFSFRALELAETENYPLQKAWAYYTLGQTYWDILGDVDMGIAYFIKAKNELSQIESLEADNLPTFLFFNLGEIYTESGMLDSALFYLNNVGNLISASNSIYFVLQKDLSDLYIKQGELTKATEASNRALKNMGEKMNFGRAEVYFSRSNLFDKLHQKDSSIYYLKKSLEVSESIGFTRLINSASSKLAETYEVIDPSQSIFYYKISSEAREKLYGQKKLQEVQSILAEEQERRRKAEAEGILNATKQRQNLFIAGIGILLFIAFLLYRNSQKEKKAKSVLKEKNNLIEETLSNLKATQSQLIQSEKMASLGELTAGIAHEIQNPLNFVNNFSEVSEELVSELKEELDNGDIEEAKTISDDVIENLKKINHHGNRASSIVKGMLEHSQTSSGEKVLTDVNALVHEYLRLSYHGLQAKDKSFQSDFTTDFDVNLPKVNVIPQDIGRVLLNLVNNGFQAVAEEAASRSKAPQPPKGELPYLPTLTLVTRLINDSPFGGQGAAFISVHDNGPGIPSEIIDKIFQPFFTTKPTGQGTGLGLSLAYDIVKAHEGELKVKSTEKEGTEFTIILPIKE